MHNTEIIVASQEQIKSHMSTLVELEKDSQLPQAWSKDNFLKELDSKWRLSKFLFYGGALVGYAIISKKTESSCHIHRFIIKSSVRRTGFGNQLLIHLKESILGQFDYITLLVDSNNNPAIEFYKKNSFKPLWEFEGNLLMAFKGGV